MGEPLDADRLVWGGSLYPPPDIPPTRYRWAVLLTLALVCVALWVVACLLIWPAVLR